MGPEELGRQLRRARQHLGFSLRDVHAVTAIPLPCLAALEEGRLDELPSPVYARGYVRSYAEAVRLDGDRLALELWRLLEEARVTAAGSDRSGGPMQPRPQQRRREPSGRPSSLTPLRQPESPWVPKPGRLRRVAPSLERIAIGALLLVLAVALWNLEQGGASHHVPRVAAFEDLRPPAPGQPVPTTVVASPAPAPSPTVLSPASDNGSQAVYATGKDHFNVVVTATDAPCWIDVRPAAGGPSLFQGTLQAGEKRPADAAGSLWVRVGNVGHVAVTVDGVPLTLPDKPSFPYNLLIQK